MSYESDQCPTCKFFTRNQRLICDHCGKTIRDKAPHWSIGSSCPDDDGSDACSHECCKAMVDRLSWDGLHGVELTYHAGKRENAREMMARLVKL